MGNEGLCRARIRTRLTLEPILETEAAPEFDHVPFKMRSEAAAPDFYTLHGLRHHITSSIAISGLMTDAKRRCPFTFRLPTIRPPNRIGKRNGVWPACRIPDRPFMGLDRMPSRYDDKVDVWALTGAARVITIVVAGYVVLFFAHWDLLAPPMQLAVTTGAICLVQRLREGRS